MIVHPLTARAFVTQQLLEHADAWLIGQGSAVRFEGRIYPARRSLTPEGWPYIVVSGGEDAEYETWAEEITLQRDAVTARIVMSSLHLPPGNDLEEFVADLDGALQFALTQPDEAALGVVHGAKLLAPYRPPLYGDDNEEICEMGWVVQVVSS